MDKARNILLLFLLIPLLFAGCGHESKIEVSEESGSDSVPTMVTRNVTTLISDSGMTRYRITSKLWLVYDEAKIPVWKFPVGLHIEKFDERFKPDAYIDCDSATYFKERQLWRLDGNVEIRNVKKELFLTQQMYWSQYNHKVYSDSFIHIEKDDRIIEGYGFESNERLTTYRINHPSGIFPVDEDRKGATAKDSVG